MSGFHINVHSITARIILLVMLASVSSQAVAWEVTNGPGKATLIELYTSEGCSSCPPADAWFSKLKEHPELWKRLVPVAFHVDYWDWIGWKDEFARKEFGIRQKDYRRKGNTRSVYTPGFFVNGQEWRGFFKGLTTASVPISDKRTGKLRASIEDGSIQVSFEPTEQFVSSVKNNQLTAHAALLEFQKTNVIKRGENTGKRLSHDFIVRQLVSFPLEASGRSTFQAAKPLPTLSRNKENHANPRAISVWVADDNMTFYQAAGGWYSD